MPYKTVLVHQNDGDGSQESIARQQHHADLRRKLLLRKEHDRWKELVKQQLEAELEREEKRVRLAAKLSRRRDKEFFKREWKHAVQSRETTTMEREERASRVAWKVLARLEMAKLQRQLKQEKLDKAPPPLVNRYDRKKHGIPSKPPHERIDVVVVPASSQLKPRKKPRDASKPSNPTSNSTTPSHGQQHSSNQDELGHDPPTVVGFSYRDDDDGNDWDDCEFDDLVDETQLASLLITS
ncbi:hypothetical protein DYB32_004824 [Aphanomyces invadans]|uniref:Uncharacterized protein n=1 Tax=Aphanomyces invadans TaxID=157072 RepID=A0A418AWC8_9STRA|nr:hypothetical protein DYB32_004824 [Aphanomyces invadans]